MEIIRRQGFRGGKRHRRMIHIVEKWLRQARRALSRDEWSWRLLRLPRPKPSDGKRGLLLIQIDGLSQGQLEKALRSGRLPFLRSLLRREGYAAHALYSGMPSTTPAAQGELFYGRPCCVPAFAYKARSDGRVMTLLNAESADRIEVSLAGESDEPLLSGGSAYSNIYTGGAAESHFCASRLSPKAVLRHSNPLALAIVLLWNLPSVLRLVTLLAMETALAIYDAARGSLQRGEFGPEFKFIFSRVLVCVGLREVVTAMASMDLMRGLPVVQLNFAGYDEQAHRRGPSSAFAHFSLRGIDRCIRRLYHASHRSNQRDYEVWVYSDHGQESTTPYLRETGRTLQEAVRSALAPASVAPVTKVERVVRSENPLGSRWENSFTRHSNTHATVTETQDDPLVLAYGPIGHIYLASPCLPELQARIAATLQKQAAIPIVLYRLAEGRAQAVTSEGVFRLPEDAAKVLGARHPFLATCATDLAELCHHADAGDFVVLGWRPRSRPLSFAWENGAHGGPGTEETHAFALLPAGVTPPITEGEPAQPFRHAHLRKLALRMRHRAPLAGKVPGLFHPRDPQAKLRVLTYNAHACEGMDGKVSPTRIARVIAQTRPDVICLQECYGADRGDLTALVMAALENDFHHDTLNAMQDGYGNAVLSAWPLRPILQKDLPTVTGYALEIRGAQWAEIEWQGLPLQVLNTHLGLLGRERLAQAEALAGEEWLLAAMQKGPTVLAGDFNAGPNSSPFRLLDRVVRDAQQSIVEHKPRNTFFGRFPVHRIDHVFLSPALQAVAAEVPRSHLTRLASDHLPVLVEMVVVPAGKT